MVGVVEFGLLLCCLGVCLGRLWLGSVNSIVFKFSFVLCCI